MRLTEIKVGLILATRVCFGMETQLIMRQSPRLQRTV